MDSLDGIEYTMKLEDSILNDMEKNIFGWSEYWSLILMTFVVGYYLRFEIVLVLLVTFRVILSITVNGYIYSFICTESVSSNENGSSSTSIRTSSNGSDFNMRENSNDSDINKKYRHLWVQCENCYGLNYKKFFRSKMNICEQCGYHLKMSSSDRIEVSIDPDTWDPMDEDMVSIDPIEFHSEEEPYRDRIDSYQRKDRFN
ncbi:putative acetyl-CoA carboxylase [Dioscorea sansibarensis]